MMKNLVIVESPAKAKTIEGYLGKDFVVKSSYGHVRDLPKDNNAIDIKNGFKPIYEISEDKKSLINELSKLVKQAETVWLATDDDREGEAISWHLKETLGIDDKKTKRIVFREITKSAILKAIANPRQIDMDLVNAQQARRVLDRLVGFELSPVLWKKVKMGLSAGRVQSVAVRLVVEREREIQKFVPTSSYKISANFNLEKGKKLEAEVPQKIEKQEDAFKFLQKCIGASFKISNLEKKPAKKSPAPPFTTSTLQQEASRKLYFSVSQTMALAQKLYEAGHISYMRTDSVNLSEDAIRGATNAIEQSFGKEYVEVKRFKTKSESAQEAHEAIRPTNFSVQQAGNDRNEQRLYELIWKRAIASQMADAKLERTIATIDITPQNQTQPLPEKLQATGEVILFDGFLKVYIESSDDEEDEEQKGMLPPLTIGQILNLDYMKALERFTYPNPRYTEASLVKKLEEMGIGRPSTYAPTISTIQQRGYIIKESREGKERKYQELILKGGKIDTLTKTEITGTEKMKLFPTDIAMQVNDFLVNYFSDVVDYSFTATVEEEFDKIASGKTEWEKMIGNFYKDFHPKVEQTQNQAERVSVSSTRKLGIDPNTGKEIIAKLGRYGAYVQIGGEDEAKPQYASLKKGQLLETISLEEALELFKLPREVGEYEGLKMIAAIGRFGPYIKHGDKFVSLKKDQDPLTISEAEAIALIEEKRQADAQKYIKEFPERPDIKVLNGRFGAYISAGNKNVKIPKGKIPAELTLEECIALVEATPEKAKGGKFAKKTEPKKEEAKPKAEGKKTETKTTASKTKTSTNKKK
ncbi:type I DNA topoisomerase [Thermoflexibacter ruber]|nr:type I DNA topoisomerase [Thermoflexibacter ruber]